MTNMQQLYAAHLENVKHNRAMEELEAEKNETARQQLEETRLHNRNAEQLQKYQSDVSASATRYTADQRNEGTHYTADSSASVTRETKQLENAVKLAIAGVTDRRADQQQKIEMARGYMEYLTKCGANEAQMRQAQAAIMNADTNRLYAIADTALTNVKTESERIKYKTELTEYLMKVAGQAVDSKWSRYVYGQLELPGSEVSKNKSQAAKNYADTVKTYSDVAGKVANILDPAGGAFNDAKRKIKQKLGFK